MYVAVLFFSLMNKNIKTDDMKMTSILSNLEEQIRELKMHCYNLANRRSSKQNVFKRKSVQKKFTNTQHT